MSNTIASHGTPSGSVFGKIGEIIGTDVGVAYYKAELDTLNIGWGNPLTPTPTPTTTPTPTPVPFPTQSFLCTEIEATGSVKCNNEFKLFYETDSVTNISINISWGRPATQEDPVYLFGNGTVASLIDNETSYFNTLVGVDPGILNVGFTRPSSSLDSGSVAISTFGAGKIRAATLYGYSTGTSPVILKVPNITGRYIFHTRNCSGDLLYGTGGIISGVRSGSSEIITASLVGNPSIELLEIVGYNDTLNFDPREIKECVPLPNDGLKLNNRFWLDRDTFGKIEATWIDTNGALSTFALGDGVPYTPILSGVCARTGSLNIIYGTNYRMIHSCSLAEPDPRSGSFTYQIDAFTNINGEYSFTYLDPYGVSRSADGVFTAPNSPVYGVVCGVSVTSVNKGSATVSTRRC